MQCMEVWGGNSSTWSHFTVPGLEVWVYSHPTGASEKGGDVYYLSSCASGRTTRLFVGDVSGHGQEAAATAEKLRQIMRQNVNFIDHTKLVNSMNQEFEKVSSPGRFATAVVGTYFLGSGRFTLCNAGHPEPFRYDHFTGQWLSFGSNDNATKRNFPFGVVEDHEFESEKLALNDGDMVLFYTDALSEAVDQNDEQLGPDGLLKLVNSIRSDDQQSLVPSILASLKTLNPSNLNNDDATLLLIRATTTRVPLKNELLSPFRYFGRLLGIR